MKRMQCESARRLQSGLRIHEAFADFAEHGIAPQFAVVSSISPWPPIWKPSMLGMLRTSR